MINDYIFIYINLLIYFYSENNHYNKIIYLYIIYLSLYLKLDKNK